MKPKYNWTVMYYLLATPKDWVHWDEHPTRELARKTVARLNKAHGDVARFIYVQDDV